ncbi:MAG: TrkA family potassium uptake protein [Elusimicrobiota bacterium]|jgi:trk system potassium uptake protein TrkA|nr:TrkA family potassium uptake protein [Elusimicrobiota bacterium]
MKKKQFVVIGLGTFGYNVACELVKKGIQVLAIDNKEEIVNTISQFVTQAVIADAGDEKAMQEAGIADCDTAIISIGEIEPSILAILIAKELGIKNIIVKCINLWHSKVAVKLGASRVIYPEFEMAKKLVNGIVSPNILEHIELSKDYNLVEIIAPKQYWQKAIKDTNIRNTFKVNIIAVRSRIPFITDDGQNDIKEEINMVPEPDYEIKQNDVLVVIGPIESLEKLKV